MSSQTNPEQISHKIQHLKEVAGDLHQAVQTCPALAKNLERILVSIRMLELNVSDLVELETRTIEKENSQGGMSL